MTTASLTQRPFYTQQSLIPMLLFTLLATWAACLAAAAGLDDEPQLSGAPRQLRVGTEGSEVPCAVGQRVTAVAAGSAPSDGAESSFSLRRRRGGAARMLLPPRPVGSSQGQWLELCNHDTGDVLPLVPPPPPQAASPGPPLLPPLLLLLAAGDGASAVVDPALPALLLVSALATLGTAATLRSRLLPALRRLPGDALEVESQRQSLLSQHVQLCESAGRLSAQSQDDTLALVRLWTLDAKMGAVQGGAAGLPGAGEATGGAAEEAATPAVPEDVTA